MNTRSINLQLIESLIQITRSLSPAEQFILDQKMYENLPEPSTQELMHLADRGGAFDFLHDEPDLYTIEDGEPIQWTQTNDRNLSQWNSNSITRRSLATYYRSTQYSHRPTTTRSRYSFKPHPNPRRQ